MDNIFFGWNFFFIGRFLPTFKTEIIYILLAWTDFFFFFFFSQLLFLSFSFPSNKIQFYSLSLFSFFHFGSILAQKKFLFFYSRSWGSIFVWSGIAVRIFILFFLVLEFHIFLVFLSRAKFFLFTSIYRIVRSFASPNIELYKGKKSFVYNQKNVSKNLCPNEFGGRFVLCVFVCSNQKKKFL